MIGIEFKDFPAHKRHTCTTLTTREISKTRTELICTAHRIPVAIWDSE